MAREVIEKGVEDLGYPRTGNSLYALVRDFVVGSIPGISDAELDRLMGLRGTKKEDPIPAHSLEAAADELGGRQRNCRCHLPCARTCL